MAAVPSLQGVYLEGPREQLQKTPEPMVPAQIPTCYANERLGPRVVPPGILARSCAATGANKYFDKIAQANENKNLLKTTAVEIDSRKEHKILHVHAMYKRKGCAATGADKYLESLLAVRRVRPDSCKEHKIPQEHTLVYTCAHLKTIMKTEMSYHRSA